MDKRKTVHALMPDRLYVHLLRTATDWAVRDNDLECARWVVEEMRIRDIEAMKGEWLSLRHKIGRKFYGKPCVICGKPADTVDHIKPINSGGTNDMDNLQPMCHSCNSRKRDTVTEE